MHKKRGATHIEVIFSSIIFISFVLFLLVYIRPFQTDTITDSIILKIKDSFEKNNSVSLERIFVKSIDVGCINLNLSGLGFSGGSHVELADSLTTADSHFNNAVVYFNATSNNQSFYVYISEEFPSSGSTCSQPKKNYVTGSSESRKVLSNTSLTNFKARYDSDYENLKLDLKIPTSVDFGISSESYVLEKNIPEGTNVIAKTFNYKILHSNGTLQHKEFTIKIW